MRGWRRTTTERLFDCRVFRLDRVHFVPADGGAGDDFYLLDAPDWINVVPVTDDGQIVMIRQYRVGVAAETLEIPGGMCDAGESPEAAAVRELREETGCVARAIVRIGSVHPNPALQGNRCHSFLATGVRFVGPPQPDPHESFDVISLPLAEVPERIRNGEITHALVITAFHFLDLRGRPVTVQP